MKNISQYLTRIFTAFIVITAFIGVPISRGAAISGDPIIIKDFLINNSDENAEISLQLSRETEILVYPIDKKTIAIDPLSNIYAEDDSTFNSDSGLVAFARNEMAVEEDGTPEGMYAVDMILLSLRDPVGDLDSKILGMNASIYITKKGIKEDSGQMQRPYAKGKTKGLLAWMFKDQPSEEKIDDKIFGDDKESKKPSKESKAEKKMADYKTNRLVAQAKRLAASGKTDQAIEIYGNILYEDPKNLEAKVLLRDLVRQQHDDDPLMQLGGDTLEGYKADSLTLKECLEIAERNHLPIRIGEYQAAAARKRLKLEKRNLFPTLTLETTYTGGINVQEEEFGGRRYSAQTSYTAFDGGQALNTVKQNELNLIVAETDLKKVRLELDADVKGQYYSYIRTKENYLLQQKVMDVTNEILKQVEDLHNDNMFTETEYINFLTEYNSTAFTFTTAKEDVDITRFALAQSMGVQPGVKFDVIPDYTFKRLAIDYNDFLRLALKNSPELIIARKLLEYYKYEMKINEGKMMPNVSINANVGRGAEGTTDQRLKLADEWFVGSVVRVPFWGNTVEYQASKDVSGPQTSTFSAGAESVSNALRLRVLDGLQGAVEKVEALVEYERQKREYGTEVNDTIVSVQEQFLAYQKSFTIMDATILRIKNQEMNRRLTELKIGLGESPVTAILSAENSLATEKFSYIQAITDYITTIANMNKIVGIKDYYNFNDNTSDEVTNENPAT